MTSLSQLQQTNTITTVSLFSGAGGLDIGAILAGAKIVWANDVKKEACESYSKNIGSHIHLGDINAYLPTLTHLENVDLVVGGPPCQGFSVAGKMDENDGRSKLIWSYAKVIDLLQPRAFIMENVKALAALQRWAETRKALLEKFRKIGYSVNFIVLNAADYGVPQARERVFFIGFKGNAFAIPDFNAMMSPYALPPVTVRQALSVLDQAGSGNNKRVCKAKITLASSPVLRKSPYAGMLFNGLGRPLKIDGFSATLPASMGGNKTPIIDEKALYEHSVPWVEQYHRLILHDPLLAQSSQIPPYLRRLTLDEARVIQTFPLEYEFCGCQSAQFEQIGNAVPCNLARAVCSMVIDVLKGKAPVVYSGLFS